MTKTSELPGFYRLGMEERRARAAECAGLTPEQVRALCAGCGLSDANADNMVENALGVMGLPLGLCVNLLVDERDRLVPMAVEEPSVVAASSYAAKLLRAGGGITTTVSEPLVIGQVQVLEVPNLEEAARAVLAAKSELLAAANQGHSGLSAAGGGAVDVETRRLDPMGPDDPCGPMLVVHLVVDVRDAMGANAVNTMCERIAPRVAELTGGRVGLRILSNLTDRRVVHVVGRVPASALEGKGSEGGLALAKRIEEASVFAERDPYRAATHNKGIMNGVDAVLVALGQDWRAVEAGAHAYAARSGRYTALATWRVEGDLLVGRMTIPMAVGTVGGVVAVHPTVRANRQIACVSGAADLAGVVAAVGLAQNLSALRALAAEGIQSGHMRMHGRNFAIEAGAAGDEVRAVAALCAERKQVSLVGARAVLAELRGSARVEEAPATSPSPVASSRPLGARGVAATGAASSADRAFCERMLPAVSRTFALSIQVLPEGLRDAICVAYLLCRVVDTVEDDRTLTPATRQRLFDLFDVALEASARGVPEDAARAFEDAAKRDNLGTSDHDRELVLGAAQVFRCFSALPMASRAAITPRAAEMSTGMREYSLRADAEGGLRMRERADLERYCHFVAGTVGELLTDLFHDACDVPEHVRGELVARANAFGVGLQLVNVLKDVAEDLVRGDCFLPRDAAQRAGLDLDRLLERSERERGLAVLRSVALVAREHLDRAREYTLLWPAHGAGLAVRRFCAVPLALALATLREIEAGDDALIPGRAPTVTRTLVMRVFGDAAIATAGDLPRGASDAGLRELFAHAGVARMDPPARPRATPVPRAGAGGAPSAQPRDAGEAPPGSQPRESKKRGLVSVSEPVRPSKHVPALEPRRTFGGKVLVTGATGHAGANLVHRLVVEGRDVRVLLRGPDESSVVDDLETVTGKRIERVFGDERAHATLSPALRGCEVVFHSAAPVSPHHDVRGTTNVLRAAGDAGVKRVVVTGSLDAPGDPVEHEVLRACVNGIDAVVATSSAMLGPLDYRPSQVGRVLLDFTHGRLRGYLPGIFELVSARDLVDGYVLALERGRTGQRYVLSTERSTADDLMEVFEEVTGRSRPRLRLPTAVVAGLAEVSSRMARLLPDVERRFALGGLSPERQPGPTDTSKARLELGYSPTSVRAAIHAAYFDFARRGLVPRSPSLERGEVDAATKGQDSGARRTKGAAA